MWLLGNISLLSTTSASDTRYRQIIKDTYRSYLLERLSRITMPHLAADIRHPSTTLWRRLLQSTRTCLSLLRFHGTAGQA